MKASLTKTLLFLAVFTWAGGYFPSTPVSADPHNAKEQKTAVMDGGEEGKHYPPVTLYEGMSPGDPFEGGEGEREFVVVEFKFEALRSVPLPMPEEDVIPISGDSSGPVPDEVM